MFSELIFDLTSLVNKQILLIFASTSSLLKICVFFVNKYILMMMPQWAEATVVTPTGW